MQTLPLGVAIAAGPFERPAVIEALLAIALEACADLLLLPLRWQGCQHYFGPPATTGPRGPSRARSRPTAIRKW